MSADPSTSSRCAAVWPLGLALLGLGAGCQGRDAGGQEGEEYDPSGSLAEDGGSGDDGGGDGTDDGGQSEFETWTGSLHHERGGGYAPDLLECSLNWSTEGERIDGSDCPDCAFVFEVEAELDRRASLGVEACADEAVDFERKVGFAPDYAGYGPAVVAVDESYFGTYMLGFARLEGNRLSWSYGYVDYAFSYGGRTYYATWLWEGEAELGY